jgi:hypothetical protein
MAVDTSLLQQVERVLESTPVHDIHTHLYDPALGPLLLSGIDELLVYHYLVSEAFRHLTIPYATFWAASREEQADLVWQTLFEDHSPISESCRGILTVLHALGLEARPGDLKKLRRWFAEQPVDKHIDRVMELAHVKSVCMTNSPFDDIERPYWERGFKRDSRFLSALRIDPLLLAWSETAARLHAQGFHVSVDRTVQNADAVRRFLSEWTRRIDSRYCMVSLPPSFSYPADSDCAWLLENAVLPHCREHGQPLALMFGVERAVNPALQLAGDGLGRSDLSALRNLCASYPDNKFLATCLSRENQHELVVLSRKFRNLHPFGCWWFTNTPQLIDEITRMRMDLLGTSFTPQHSDARVLEQLIYKWDHSKTILARCLAERYSDIAQTGWPVSGDLIRRDVSEWLGGSFEQFLKSA